MALTKVSRGLLSTSIVDNGNAIAITIDSSENIGLGLVPTDFANRTSLDIGLGGKIWGHAAATETGHGSNFYFDGAYKRIAAVAPTRHVQNGNGHTFSVAASGAADSTITWDDALIVSPSGSVGIGTTIFPQDFTVLGNHENAGFYRDYTGAGVAANYVNIGRKDTNGSLVSGVRISGGGDDAVAASHNGYFEIATRKAGSFVPLLSSYSGGSDLVVNEGGIDMDFRVESDNSTHALFVQGSSSNVGIGTSSPYASSSWNRVLHVQSAGTGSSIRLADSVSGTSGEVGLLVGQYSNDAYFVNRDSGGVSIWANNTERLSITSVGAIFATGVRSSSAANSDLRYNTSNGEIYYQTSSERYKSNIADLEFDTSNLYNLRPVSFDDNENGERCFGLIAEETFEQIPEAVVTRDIDGETVPDSIPYSMLSVIIINEMKKLKVENDSLKARLTALEN